MMVMTAKLNFKKTGMLIAVVFVLILSLILLMDSDGNAPAAGPSMAGNTQRIQFLSDMGWQVSADPVEACEIKIPREMSPVYERYNNLQKSQGYDLSDYAGKKALRYVYEIKNYPGAKDPVYATLLVFKDSIIGGDITDTGTDGKIRGLKNTVKAQQKETIPEYTESTTVPEETSEVQGIPH